MTSASAPDPQDAIKILVASATRFALKYWVIQMNTETCLARGVVDGIGREEGAQAHAWLIGDGEYENRTIPGNWPTHDDAARAVLTALQDASPAGLGDPASCLTAVGHRVRLAGPNLTEALIDEDIERAIREYAPLRPEHNPYNLAVIESLQRLLPALPNVAVFDTGFHSTMPDHAYTYAIPRELSLKHRLRRYGFHGISHRYVATEAARLIGKPLARLNLITCHLGEISSLCAVARGQSVDCTAGLSPNEGPCAGTSAGSVDPAILTYLMEHEHLSTADMIAMISYDSGLKGLCGLSRMEDVEAAREAGDQDADLALRTLAYAVRKHIGAFFAVLGHVDALVFTGVIGERSAALRAEICRTLAPFGISILDNLNQTPTPTPHAISPTSAKAAVFVIPSSDELEIARATMRVLASSLT